MRKITVFGVIQDGIGIGLKNAPSLLGAVILWILTIWIPYINVGTTIAMASIPIELSRGKIISPTFIFDGKYRKFMGEFFTLIGLMSIAIFPAMIFMIIPGIVIAMSWSLSVFLLIDKGISPTQAMLQSNNATYGYKWTIFGIYFVLGLAINILGVIFGLIPFFGVILAILLSLAFVVIQLGCSAVIYRDLTKDDAEVVVKETVE